MEKEKLLTKLGNTFNQKYQKIMPLVLSVEGVYIKLRDLLLIKANHLFIFLYLPNDKPTQ